MMDGQEWRSCCQVPCFVWGELPVLRVGVPISTNTATVESFEQPTPHFLLEV